MTLINRVLDFSTIAFPIVAFGKDKNLMILARNEYDLTTCTKSSLINGFYAGLQIIDSNGFSFIIFEARKVATVGLLGGYNIFLNQKLKVELILEKSETDERNQMQVDQLQKSVIKCLKNDLVFWNGDGRIGEKIRIIEKLNSISEILGYLTTDYYNSFY